MKICAYLLLLCLLTCCAFPPGYGTAPVSDEKYQLDGVKLIVRGIGDMQHPSTFAQREYEVGPERRLLLRLETLKKHADKITVDNGRTVRILLTLARELETGETLPAMKLCPVVRTWMMHATWELAHPFGSDGIWWEPGGDYETGYCSAPVLTDRTLTFDVKSWFVEYVRGQGYNRGLILLSDAPIRVQGEMGGSYPQISFSKWVTGY